MIPGKPSRLVERLREIILRTQGLPGWVCVGHADPQTHLRVSLETAAAQLDIAGNHAIVALRPLTIAVGAEQQDIPILSGARARIVIREPAADGGAILGRVKLRLHGSVPAGDMRVCLFRTEGGRNFCVPMVRRQITYLYERWRMFRDRNPRNMPMLPSEMFSLWILHHVPRPVLLVSYGEMARANMFPMDLLGRLRNGWFILGLHSGSPAIDIWRDSPHIAVSAMPLGCKPAVYAMGKNHREPLLDPRNWPIACGASINYRIPAPDAALSVRELRVQKSLGLGSHVLFTAEPRTLDVRAVEPQMCHVHRFYQQFLADRNRSLPMSD